MKEEINLPEQRKLNTILTNAPLIITNVPKLRNTKKSGEQILHITATVEQHWSSLVNSE
jgi:hypothetical protein